jgi:hypothetical protein
VATPSTFLSSKRSRLSLVLVGSSQGASRIASHGPKQSASVLGGRDGPLARFVPTRFRFLASPFNFEQPVFLQGQLSRPSSRLVCREDATTSCGNLPDD